MYKTADLRKIKIPLSKDNSVRQMLLPNFHQRKRALMDVGVKFILLSIIKDQIIYQQATSPVITKERRCLTFIHWAWRDQIAIFHHHSLYKTALLKTSLEWKV
jgi:hypothetical protein